MLLLTLSMVKLVADTDDRKLIRRIREQPAEQNPPNVGMC